MTLVSPGARVARASSHTDFVVDQIGRAIVAGDYPELSMIPLDPDLCEMFDVSRTVIREAKKTLIAKGLLQSKAKVGTQVKPRELWNMFDVDVLRWHCTTRRPSTFYEELLAIRLIFEPSAARQVAENNPAAAKSLLPLAEALATAKSREDYALADFDFHKAVLRMTGNRFLISLGDMVQTALYSLYLTEEDDFQPDRNKVVAEKHKDVAQAIMAGDGNLASQRMYDVIADGSKRAVSLVAD